MEEALVPRTFGETLVEGHDRIAIGIDCPTRRDPSTITEKEVTGGSHRAIVTRPVVIVNGPVYIFGILGA
jgi:hypothetical protein